MNGAQAQQKLEEVEQGLTRAVDTLVTTPSRVTGICRELEQLTRVMKNVYQQRATIGPNASLIPPLRRIQARLRSAQLLLDTAATFYCGAISSALAQSGAYTHEGEVLRTAHHRGYLKVEA